MVDECHDTLLEIAGVVANCRALIKTGRDAEALVEAVKLADRVPTSSDELAALSELATIVARPTWVGLFCARYLEVADDPIARITLAEVYLRQGKVSEAILQIEAATRGSDTSHEVLARAYEFTRKKRFPAKLAISISERVLAFNPDSFYLRFRHVHTVAESLGNDAAIPFLSWLRSQCGSDVSQWMMIAGFQGDIGLQKSGLSDFKSGLAYLHTDNLQERYAVILAAGRLRLFKEMAAHVKILRGYECSDITMWETILQKGQEYACGPIAQLSAERLIQLDRSHFDANKFLQRGSSRMLFDKLAKQEN